MEDNFGNEGLGLAEAAGLAGEEQSWNFLQSFWQYFQADMISSIPITICSIAIIAVILERAVFFNRNSCNISLLLNSLQESLEKGNLDHARSVALNTHSITGEVAEEGIRLLAVNKEDFSRAYDVTTYIVVRRLQRWLGILATVGAIAPFLGLFGTVSGVIKALYRMSLGSGSGSLEMIGEISNALIATGYGLAIAIIAVVFNNYYNNIVKKFENDFQLLKLLFMSFMEVTFFDTGATAGGPGLDQMFESSNPASGNDPADEGYPDFLQ